MPQQRFTISARARTSAARVGILTTAHGDVPTPCFMPIATVGAVRHVTPAELRTAGASMVLANTYHLALRPGTEELAARGGLHRFMGWDGPILTDSGGFQVFSLGDRVRARGGRGFVDLSDAGVRFRSHLDGSAHLLTPERAVEHQRNIGSDVAMALDVCPPQPCADDVLRAAVERTTAWAERTIAHAQAIGVRGRMQLFGIVQGGGDAALRRSAAAAITALPFDGFAIGGVAVGESMAEIRRTVEVTAPLLPEDRPRYLMGVGTPADIAHAVQQGVDSFDCVLPTRDARHGRAYRWRDRAAFPNGPAGSWYETVNLTNAQWQDADVPIDPACACSACATASLAYLRHLFAIGEPLGQRYATLHNLTFIFDVMRALRAWIPTV